jgi:hypothetical protein
LYTHTAGTWPQALGTLLAVIKDCLEDPGRLLIGI